MLFLPISFLLLILFILLLPLLFFLVQAGVIGIAFSKLGLSAGSGILFFLACLIGSGINIPIRRRPVVVAGDEEALPALLERFFGFRVPRVSEQILAINVGGAVLPLLLSVYLLPRVPLWQTIVAAAIVAAVAKKLSRPVTGAGIALPAFIPPIVSALLAVILAPASPAPTAFVAGVVGTLVGADLLNLHRIDRMGRGVMSIGGAGVFDGIFLVGIFSVLLS